MSYDRGDATAAVAETFDATPANLDARTQLSRVGGLQVALLPKGTRGQAVQARLRLHYGDVDSLKGQQTVAALAASLVEKGGAGMSRQQVADAFDRLQANVSFSGSGQTLNVAITTKRRPAAGGGGTGRQAAARPAMPRIRWKKRAASR